MEVQVGMWNSLFVCGCLQGLPEADSSFFLIILLYYCYFVLYYCINVNVYLYDVNVNVKILEAQSEENVRSAYR